MIAPPFMRSPRQVARARFASLPATVRARNTGCMGPSAPSFLSTAYQARALAVNRMSSRSARNSVAPFACLTVFDVAVVTIRPATDEDEHPSDRGPMAAHEPP